ncbi:RNA polymerase sigma factor [Demequina mangrovi]|uniref:RNA polymerase sigma-70 factor, ECF subfamily n=1 Tax=Demequina mangrovi TaxID=1043493 RepID=A0A1H6V7V6_9MICO|nr:sigma-70 family RNA polymerase sigma factor [Demequina mangrovi]SEJ00618.1 RNA polymerase sigma-70 factor, ECF subfamily [Demequina mangrovi]
MTLGPAFESTLAAARLGEEWAWTALYRELAGPVRGYLAARRSPSPEDEAADTFLDVARGIDRFEGDESDLRSWVFAIAHRRMVDAVRRSGRRPETPVADEGLAQALRDVIPSAEHQALLHSRSEGVEQLLATLSERQRDVLLLRVVAGLSGRETAAALEMSEPAVRVTQHRALAALRKAADRADAAV